jgi:hypothetical protein
MHKRDKVKSGLYFGIAMTIFFILQDLLTHDNLTIKNIIITVVSALFGGALAGLSAHTLDELKASGASQIEIDKQTKEMESFARMFKNPFFNAMMTYVEILPVGLIVTLISSLILKRKAQ